MRIGTALNCLWDQKANVGASPKQRVTSLTPYLKPSLATLQGIWGKNATI